MRKVAYILFFSYLVTLCFACAFARAAGGITRHDRDVIRFFQHHPRLARTPAGGAALAEVLPRVVRSLQEASIYPPHHKLWRCIGWYESGDNPASPGTIDPARLWEGGHGGLLGMSPGWMDEFQGDPALLTDAQQEWAAERAWAANGYSYAFLYQQWYEWDAAAVCGS